MKTNFMEFLEKKR